MLLDDTLQPVNPVVDHISLNPVESCVNAFCTLFSHHARSRTPLSDPWHNMMFQEVHFGEYAMKAVMLLSE